MGTADTDADPSSYGFAAGNLHDEYIKSQEHVGAAFKKAWADDAAFQEGIERIVEELERGDDTGPQETEKARAEKAKAAQRARAAREKQERKTNQNAKEQADDWLRKQVSSSKSAKGKESTSKRAEGTGVAPNSTTKEDTADSSIRAAYSAQECSRDTSLEQVIFQAARIETKPASRSGIFTWVPLPARLPEPGGGSDVPEPTPTPAQAIIASKAAPEFYMLLGVKVDATYEEIKKAYRKQALLWHPDKNRHRLDEATERFKRITTSFDTLYDPVKREAYDSGKAKLPSKAKKLQGHGWSNLPDEDDGVLSKRGLKMKMKSWYHHWSWNGRIDDDPDQLVFDDKDPRYPQEKIKIFWRWLGEQAWLDRENGDANWLRDFVSDVWKDTPSRWPKGPDLANMNEASQQEWKERRMMYNRRKHKVMVAVELHEEYLAIPGREKKEKDRILKMFPQSMGNVKWNV